MVLIEILIPLRILSPKFFIKLHQQNAKVNFILSRPTAGNKAMWIITGERILESSAKRAVKKKYLTSNYLWYILYDISYY